MGVLAQTWFPGVLLGGYCFVYGLTLGFLAATRKWPMLAYGLQYGLLALCAVLVGAGIVLYATGQRSSLWQAYGIAGGIGLIAAWGMGVALKGLYR